MRRSRPGAESPLEAVTECLTPETALLDLGLPWTWTVTSLLRGYAGNVPTFDS